MINTKQVFSVSTTKSSVVLKHGNITYVFSSTKLRNQDLWIFRDVKNTAALKLPDDIVLPSEPTYNFMNPTATPDIFGEGFTEIDVNAAYWNIAYKRGILSSKAYKKGMELTGQHKIIRLAALGALARKRSNWIFDGNDWIHQGVEYDEWLASVFYSVALELSDYMSEALRLCGTGGVCFWVDNLICRNEHVEDVLDYFDSKGLDCTTLPLKACRFGDGSRYVKMYHRQSERDTQRSSGIGFKTFTFPLVYTGVKSDWDGNTAAGEAIIASRLESRRMADLLEASLPNFGLK